MSAQSLPATPTPPRQADRMGFLFCLAAALHAAVILGVGFSHELRQQSASRLEITLVQRQSPSDKADFLAQHDQAGSGTLDKKALLTKREETPFRDNVNLDPKRLKLARSEMSRAEKAQVATTAERERSTTTREAPDSRTRQQHLDRDRQTQLNEEVASLEARLDIQRQAYANRPKRRVLTSVSTKRAADALYLHNWRTQVEAVGNRHYPEKARREDIEGSLRLLVALMPDGSVREVKVLKSSGHALLDQAAQRIVHLAAPYQPFPDEIRREVDILEIIRTWRFEKSRLSSSS